MRVWPTFFFLAFFTLQSRSFADDFSYISNEELLVELQQQQDDLSRAQARLASLEMDEIGAVAELQIAQKNKKETEKIIRARVQLLNRMLKSRGLGKYLLESGSSLEALKLLHTLKHLVVNGLETFSQTSKKVIETQAEVDGIRQEIQQTNKMLTVFEAACKELLDEQQRRSASDLESD